MAKQPAHRDRCGRPILERAISPSELSNEHALPTLTSEEKEHLHVVVLDNFEDWKANHICTA